MQKVGILNNRNIFYQSYAAENVWAKHYPDANWLAIIITSGRPKADLFNIAKNIIERNVCYVCCASDQGELLHDIVDEEILIRQLGLDNNRSPKTDAITTWHNNIPDGLWYAIYTADDDLTPVTDVICLDAGEISIETDITQLVEWFGEGYIPPE